MKNSIRKTLATALATGAMVLGLTVATTGTASAQSREPQTVTQVTVAQTGAHYWYLKPSGWRWTSHKDVYDAYLASGGIGNGTAGPDYSKQYRAPKGSTNTTQGGDTGTAPAPSSNTSSVVSFARAQLGKAYRYGGNGPNAYDCSGLTQQAYRAAGKSIPRVAADQAAASHRISRSQLQPGDLIFWSSNGRVSGVYHVAIYIGGNQFIAASHAGKPISVGTLSPYYAPAMYGRF